MKVKRILVIAWEFPPKQNSESFVTYKHLYNSQFEFDIVTEESELDSSEFDLSKFTIIRVNKKQFYKNPFKYIDFNKYDIFMTRVMPEDGNTVGFKIKKKFKKLKWIVSFSDPNFNDIYIKNKYFKSKNKCLELLKFIKNHRYYFKEHFKYKKEFKKILIQSDLIIFNNKYQRKYMLGKKKKLYVSKTMILPHSFDKLNFKNKKSTKAKIISYVGVLDDTRTPQFLFESLYKLKKEDPDLLKNVKFQFYGDMPNEYQVYAKKHLQKIVNINSRISYVDSLKVMQNSDYLLVIDADLSNVIDHQIFLPAKVFDYIGSQKQILGITMSKGPLNDLLIELKETVIDYDYEKLKFFLKTIHETRISIYDHQIYNAKIVSKMLDNKIKELEKI